MCCILYMALFLHEPGKDMFFYSAKRSEKILLHVQSVLPEVLFTILIILGFNLVALPLLEIF